jgi:hypothetical protein
MNGHSGAEITAFSMMEIARRWGQSIGVRDESPVFLFAAGWRSGEEELAKRLPFSLAGEYAVAATVLVTLANQLLCVSSAWSEVSEAAEAIEFERGGLATLNVPKTAAAQARFLRELCANEVYPGGQRRWGLALTGLAADYALYLRILFPKAKFVFLHRNPLETLGAYLSAMPARATMTERGIGFASGFADHWCRTVASFSLWHKDVGGIMIGYADAVADQAQAIEEYLGEQLSPSDPREQAAGLPVLRQDEADLLIERTGDLASRCGYTLRADPTAACEPSLVQPRPPGRAQARAVHTESQRIRCAVLVPTMRYIEPECDEGLWELERRGYTVSRVRGCSAIDRARSRLATAALEKGFEETIWIDADTGFDPDSIERLRSHELPIVAGLYARRHPCAGLAMSPMPGTDELTLGEEGGLVEVLYAGTGFLLVRREVYEGIQRRFGLCVCDANTPRRTIPFFMPMLEDWGGHFSYLSEDYAFSRRARLCGYKIIADTSIRLWHIGMYRYGYEDAGHEVPRAATYRHVFKPE